MMGEAGEDPGGDDAGVRVVLTTAPAGEVAERLVSALVEERLVACGTILPGGVSIYRWKGEVVREEEALVVLKTTAAGVQRLQERLPALHPYDVPELLALPVEAGHAPYLEWVAASVANAQDGYSRMA